MRRSLTTALVILVLGLGGRAEAQGVNQRVADLEALVVQMQAQIDDLNARLTAAEQGVDTNATDISNIVASGYVTASDLTGYATQTWVTSQGYATGAELGDLPDLASYLSVNSATNAIVFSGANVFVQNGSGGTSGINGLGNLIVGYNESNNDLRGGSHNLVIGRWHSYTSYGGLVAGEDNAVLGAAASVAGGNGSAAAGDFSSVAGGDSNLATGQSATVGGGVGNHASGERAAIVGGANNRASAELSAVVGGIDNEAGGLRFSIVVGGAANDVSGGQFGVVLGGENADVTGSAAVVLGGQSVSAPGNFDIKPSVH